MAIIVEAHPAYVQTKKYVTGMRDKISKWRYRCSHCGYASLGYGSERVARQMGEEMHRCSTPSTFSNA